MYILRLRNNGKEKCVTFSTFTSRQISFKYIPPTGNEGGKKPIGLYVISGHSWRRGQKSDVLRFRTMAG